MLGLSLTYEYFMYREMTVYLNVACLAQVTTALEVVQARDRLQRVMRWNSTVRDFNNVQKEKCVLRCSCPESTVVDKFAFF